MTTGESVKSVMLAAYYFPPMASVSWMRVTKFAKYLPQAGWTPMVVTVDGRYYPRTVEGSLPPEVESLDVHRFGYWSWLPVPVAKLLFPVYVLWKTLRSRHRLDAVVFFGSPFYPFLVVPLVRVLTGLPVVLDLRDGWSTWHEEPKSGRANLGTNRIRRLIEKTGFHSACSVVFATEILRRQYAERFSVYRQKFFTVTNGFDLDDLDSEELPSDQRKNYVVLAGKFLFYTPRVAQWILETLADYPDWRFVYIGEESEAVMSLARSLNAESRVTVKGYLPYREVLQEIHRAKLCITTNSYSEGLGTKIFDYLAMRKRVLCFVPSVSEIAKQFEGVPGVTVCRGPHSREGVAAGLKQAIESEEVSVDSVAGFSRQKKAAQLAKILDLCVADRGESEQ